MRFGVVKMDAKCKFYGFTEACKPVLAPLNCVSGCLIIFRLPFVG